MASSRDVYVESVGQKYKLQVLLDFREFKEFALSRDGWAVCFSGDAIVVESKAPSDGSTKLNIIRVRREMKDVPPEDLYDNLHDAEYRKTWDDNMIEGYNIVKLNDHNDVGYYSAKFPWPLKNRDFCNMRSWMEFTNNEYIIFNHSVPHSNCPEKKNFVRARSILTGYLIQPMEGNSGGCVLTYITQSDPCGSIPHAVINFTITRVVPKVMDTCEKCSQGYPEFAKKNHTVPRDSLSWRTPKMDWDSPYNFPKEALDVKKTATGTALKEAQQQEQQQLKEKPSLDSNTGEDQTVAIPNKTQPLVPITVSDSRTETLSLAPVAPNRSDDPIAFQQYRALMQDAMNTVDKTFLQEGRTPTFSEYLTRVGFIIDGVRQTTPL